MQELVLIRAVRLLIQLLAALLLRTLVQKLEFVELVLELLVFVLEHIDGLGILGVDDLAFDEPVR